MARTLVATAAESASSTITILHTSDLHGHVHPHDVLADRDFGEGLARVAAAVRQIRAEGGPTLLLDSGDTIQGDPTQSLAFAGQLGDGHDPIIKVMNRIRYDAAAIGNHEFDFGLRRLARSRAEARFPFLSANVVDESGKPVFTPYVVQSAGHARVGVLGLTTRAVPLWESPSSIPGLRFLDTVSTAKRYLSLLRERERCDLVVVLTHQGFERDPETGADLRTSGENQAYALATEVSGIDLLLTGHTHTAIEPRRLSGAWVSQPGRFGNTLTRFDVTLRRAPRGWIVSEIRGRNLSMKAVAPDPEIVRLSEPDHEEAMARLATVVGRLPEAVSAHNAHIEDTPILDWLHEVERREGHADLSVA